ncbi:type VII secretion protein EssB [Bacillus sp. CECT 9360]|uniref:type VII secretion protein EssB n=1 Tax=Bacillus sp. CECT 9360 TaxID=2845821 RepID=UPI001E315068|nr:type VII secretion protein EssB [Bacillus sp. CECT 9360]CAH0347674.1 hypothetical protein BCI9360_04095 [Bacillus sp. CECT 9360]
MEENKTSYLEKRIEASIAKDDGYVFVFQRARLKMQNQLELQLLQEIDSVLQKKIEVTDDEVIITINPPDSFYRFERIRKKNKLARWIFAHQLIKRIENHKLERLNLILCPENIMFDSSLTPYLLHYGVKDSIPPYENDEERLLQEVKATVLAAAGGQYGFEQYYQYHQTLKLSDEEQKIMAANSLEDISEIIQANINELDKQERALLHIPSKQWKVQRYVLLGAIVLLVPALIYTFYSLFFLQPKQEAYVDSGQAFLDEKYSEVINLLENYDPEDMPYVVQYELASSYIVNEPLTDEQRKTIENEVTLQTDSQYLLYWIYVGRGMNEEAIDIARGLEHKDLIVYGLINYVKEIRSDDSRSGEEKEQELQKVEEEIDEYEREREEMNKRTDEEQQNQSSTTDGQSTQEQMQSPNNVIENKPQLPASSKAPSDLPKTEANEKAKDEQ